MLLALLLFTTWELPDPPAVYSGRAGQVEVRVPRLEADLSVPALAARAAMSLRTFARVFRAEVGTTPAAYVQQVRVEAARRLLETTRRTVDDIARACGFGTVETMHRTFQRTVHTSPGQYRRLFAVPA